MSIARRVLKLSVTLEILVSDCVKFCAAGLRNRAALTIKSLDAKLFDAYNHCDLTTLGAMVSDDLEFYHDQTGLSIGKASFLVAIKQNVCGKVQRELLPQTLEVCPLKGYGALEIGVHRFHHPGDPANVGDAKFIMLWQNKDDAWKVTRVISYEHNYGLLAK